MTRAQLFAGLIIAALGGGTFAQDARAEFSLRGGADLRPLIFTGEQGGNFGDAGYLGITVGAGYKLVPMITAELALTPLIPISGSPEFQFLVSPGVIVDLYVIYVRGAIPFEVTNGRAWLEAAAGISFLMKGYVGLFLDYEVAAERLGMGAELGFRF